ncbi:hypothetical protein [Streptomyces sp. NBC_01268]|uniref:hypothetical protein n=1 Tax=Streptomyces sp. NBC_01268 TaxID=2903806 RepID=UPI002E2EC8C9|nr:hypothetical protein [Streptomyces sp. NBC_01268]
MPPTRASLVRTAVAVAVALAGLGLGVPQATAEGPGAVGAKDRTTAAVAAPVQRSASAAAAPAAVSATASASTRAIAAADPAAVRAAATVCGSGWTLDYAETLPPHLNRLGTLFIYVGNPPNYDPNDVPVCTIFDNNTGSRKWMKLKLCSNYIDDGCAEDVGNYSQYAGPVYRTRGGCGKVTAIMKNTSTSSTALIDAIRGATTCN